MSNRIADSRSYQLREEIAADAAAVAVEAAAAAFALLTKYGFASRALVVAWPVKEAPLTPDATAAAFSARGEATTTSGEPPTGCAKNEGA